jgi:hypothetical protein
MRVLIFKSIKNSLLDILNGIIGYRPPSVLGDK